MLITLKYYSLSYFNKYQIKGDERPDEVALKIYKDSSCDWIDDLLTAVYITHTKILLSVGKNNNNKKIDLVIPTTNNVI